MTVVKFYDSADDRLLKFAVIVSRSGGKCGNILKAKKSRSLPILLK